MVVVLDEPEKDYWATTSAAPLFGHIAERIMGLPARYHKSHSRLAAGSDKKRVIFTSLKQEQKTDETKAETLTARTRESRYHLPRLTGLSKRKALRKLADLRVTAKVSGHGVVVRQRPGPGTKLGEDSVCHLICSEDEKGTFR